MEIDAFVIKSKAKSRKSGFGGREMVSKSNLNTNQANLVSEAPGRKVMVDYALNR